MRGPSAPRTADALVAAAVLVVGVGGLSLYPVDSGFRSPDALAVVFTIGQGLPLVLRRSLPVAAFLAVWIMTVGYFAAGYPPFSPAWLGAVTATFSVAAHGPLRVGRLAGGFAAGMLLVLAIAAEGRGEGFSLLDTVLVGVAFGAAFLLGDRVRRRRSHLEALEARAKALEDERNRGVETALATERARIARDLHDIIAHGLSVMVLHAGAAQEVLSSDSEAARRSLRHIERSGREALTELRTTLQALRTDDRNDGRRPQPGLGSLDTLAAEMAESGLRIGVAVEGDPVPIPAGIDLSAYRVVQEALTNTLRHSTAREAGVVVRYGRDRVVVHVTDEGESKPAPQEPGYGLIGIRERVELFGGRLEAGPRPDGGFQVVAVFPLDRGSA